jgi:DNA helicase II / ATP-dependent DNA helicase PcrA
VYAPRAGQFLEIDEAKDVFGTFLVLLGRPNVTSPGMAEFADWIRRAHKRGKQIVLKDRSLAAFIKSRQEQMARVLRNRRLLVGAVGECGLDQEITAEVINKLRAVPKLSVRARVYLRGGGLRRLFNARRAAGRRLTIRYVINRVTALNWGVLDLFYELTRFEHFRRAFDLAERGQDEGPICNLALVTDYLGRFQTLNSTVLSASFLENGGFVRTFFSSFLYGLWRRGQSEYEDADDPFQRDVFVTTHPPCGCMTRV